MMALVSRVLSAAYRGALRLYPRPFRHRFGPAMLRAFTDGFAGRTAANRRLGAALWASRAVADAVVSGLAERRLSRRRETAAAPRAEPMRDVVQDLRFALRTIR